MVPDMHILCTFGENPSITFSLIPLPLKNNPKLVMPKVNPNLVNLDQTRLELSRGQKCYRQTDGRTDGQTQATTIPLRPKRPRGKKVLVNLPRPV